MVTCPTISPWPFSTMISKNPETPMARLLPFEGNEKPTASHDAVGFFCGPVACVVCYCNWKLRILEVTASSRRRQSLSMFSLTR